MKTKLGLKMTAPIKRNIPETRNERRLLKKCIKKGIEMPVLEPFAYERKGINLKTSLGKSWK